jgi:hypothetical protein
LPYNFYLGNLINIKYNNRFPILNIEVIDLATYFLKNSTIKISRLYYKNSEIEIKYYTSTIIYGNMETTRIFSNLLDKFPENLFNNIKFIDLLENY